VLLAEARLPDQPRPSKSSFGGFNVALNVPINGLEAHTGVELSVVSKVTSRVNTAFSIAVSGMQAASLRLEAAARNIANAGSEGALPDAQGVAAPRQPYQPVTVEQQALPNGGVTATLRKISPGFVAALQPGSSQADGRGMVAMPDVDMATEVTNLVTAKQAFAANAQVLRVTDEMLRSLYDILDDADDRKR